MNFFSDTPSITSMVGKMVDVETCYPDQRDGVFRICCPDLLLKRMYAHSAGYMNGNCLLRCHVIVEGERLRHILRCMQDESSPQEVKP